MLDQLFCSHAHTFRSLWGSLCGWLSCSSLHSIALQGPNSGITQQSVVRPARVSELRSSWTVRGGGGGGEMLSTYDPTSFRLLYFTHYTSYPYTFLAPSPSRPPLHSVSSLIGQYGNDSNAGTLQAPFLTLNQARNAIRTLKSSLGGSLPAGGVLVQVRGRDYAFLSAPFTLSQQDSGTAQSPIV